MKRIVFWQNIISPHQIPYIRELVTLAGVEEVVLVVSESLTEDLAKQGWVGPYTGSVTVLVKPDSKAIAQLLRQEPQQTVHILGGFRLYPYVPLVFSARRRHGFPCGVVAEGADNRGCKGLLRYVVYSIEYLRYRHLVDFILAMGVNGKNWYCRVGWHAEKIFPFAYVTDSPTYEPDSLQSNKKAAGKIKLLYIGQLIHRKGADVLLRALAALGPRHDWHLSLVGTGHMDLELSGLVKQLGLTSQTSFLGAIPNPKIHDLMVDSDLLVLPSRFDGWGAVVNEALMCGTPVLCSNMCGAKDLLNNTVRGEVLLASDVEKWADALCRWIGKGNLTYHDRNQIRAWSRNISGTEVAGYLVSVLNHVYFENPRPIPPWMVY